MLPFTRRQTLQLLGLAGAGYASGLGLGPMRVFSKARAADSPVPRRIVFFYTQQGTHKHYNMDGSLVPMWAPTGMNVPAGKSITKPWSTTDFELRAHHAPLEEWKKKITIIHGMDMVSASKDTSAPKDAHMAGATHALTGAPRFSGALAGGVSIDQFIAKTINSPSPLTAVPSLELLVDFRNYPWPSEASYAGAGQPMPLQGDAGAVYDRLFPDGPHNDDAAAMAALERQISQQRSVLDFAQKGFTSSSKDLGALDRKRLDAHGAAIRDLETRLTIRSNVTCTEPERSIINTNLSPQATQGQRYDGNAEVMLRLSQVALACDLTRVIHFFFQEPLPEQFGYTSQGGTVDFHDMVHKTSGFDNSVMKIPEAEAIITRYHAYHTTLFSRFLAMLDSIPEADGTTLLDNTAVVWCGQICGGDHSLDHIPYIIGGGLGGAINPGRFVVTPRSTKNPWWPSDSIGLPHNDLFVSLANAMGAPTEKFGNPETCNGPLPSGVLT